MTESIHTVNLSCGLYVHYSNNDNNITVHVSKHVDSKNEDVLYRYNGTHSNFYNTKSYLVVVSVVNYYIRNNYNTSAISVQKDLANTLIESFFAELGVTAPVEGYKPVTSAKPTETARAPRRKRRYAGTHKVTQELIDKIVDSYESQNKTPNEIAVEFKLSPDTVSRHLNKAGYKQLNKNRTRAWNDARVNMRRANAQVAAAPAPAVVEADPMRALQGFQAPN